MNGLILSIKLKTNKTLKICQFTIKLMKQISQILQLFLTNQFPQLR